MTQMVAMEITKELASSREKIERTRGRVQDVNSTTDRARRMLTAMSRRETCQRIAAYGICFLLIVGTAVLVYFVFLKNR